MPRIDLFTSPDCPGCPAARAAVAAFARRHPDVEVHEWDLSQDPGPAEGRGIFATPSLLVNGVHVLVGVPKESDLLERVRDLEGPSGDRHVLVVNAYDDFPRRPVFEVLSRAGYVPVAVDTVSVAVQALRTRSFDGVVVGLNPRVDPEGRIEGSGIGVWAEVLRRLGDTPWASRPILVTSTSAVLVRSELARHGITNPVVVVTEADLRDPAFPRAVAGHFALRRDTPDRPGPRDATPRCGRDGIRRVGGGRGAGRKEGDMRPVEAAEEVFAAVESKYGFVPNVIREMAKSPSVARVYVGGQEALSAASLSVREQQAVQLAISAYNGCDYCRAAHGLGARMARIAPEEVDAIGRGSLPREPRLRSLVSTALLILEKRGWLGEDDVRAIESQGVDRAQIYEVIALIGLKTISNYVNHIAHTELDAAFRTSR